MVDPLKLFILAGEASGDRIGADLVARLRARLPIALSGVGGDELVAADLASLYPMSDLSVMGISDVLRRLPLLLWRLAQTARAIRRLKPDIVVLVDAQDFSRLLAQRLRASNYTGKLILYVSPSVWSRHPERATKLRPLFDEVLAVLPFEPALMDRLGGPPTSYVGHPALAERIGSRALVTRGPLILLPGSREGELRRHLPLFRDVAGQLAGHDAVDGIVIPTLRSLKARIERAVADWPVPVRVVDERSERVALYQRAVAALAVSGTVTLELALAQVPMLVSYVMDGQQARIYAGLGSPPVSLPNIILAKPVVPELVQSTPDASARVSELKNLLDSKKAREEQMASFDGLSQLMETGEAGFPRQDPADRVLSHWRGVQRLARPT